MKDKIHIISTASLPVEYVQQMEQHGIEAEIIPFIRTYPSVSEENWQRIKRLEQQRATVVFTSVHAVTAVAEHIDHKVNWQIACIASATLEAVTRHFDQSSVIATAPYATQLAKELINHTTGPVIFFCGNKRLDTIPQQLQEAGIAVEEIVVYHTELTPQWVKADADGIMFFSGSAAESFFLKNELGKDTVCFAIGTTTADALRERTGNKIVIAENPGKKEMTELVIQYYHEHS